MSSQKKTIMFFLSILEESQQNKESFKNSFIWSSKYLTVKELYNFLFQEKEPENENSKIEIDKVRIIFANFINEFTYNTVKEFLLKRMYEDRIFGIQSNVVLKYYLTDEQIKELKKAKKSLGLKYEN